VVSNSFTDVSIVTLIYSYRISCARNKYECPTYDKPVETGENSMSRNLASCQVIRKILLVFDSSLHDLVPPSREKMVVVILKRFSEIIEKYTNKITNN
jgi:hypothetical protein